MARPHENISSELIMLVLVGAAADRWRRSVSGCGSGWRPLRALA